MTVAAENVVGGLLIDNAAFWRVSEIITADDLPPALRALYARIEAAVREGKPYDSIEAVEDGFLEAMDLVRDTASTANIEGWARRVAETSETKRVRDAGRRITTCDTYGEAQEILAAVRPEQAAQVKTVEDGLAELVDTLEARYQSGSAVTGVPTGLESLDDLTSGWQPGNLIVLVGETSMGKSALALQSAIAAAQYGKDHAKGALYFSLEMTAGELTERAVANLADFPMAWMTHPKAAPDYALEYVRRGSAMFKELPLMFDDRCGLTVEQIVSRTIQVHMRRPLAAVFVDYLHIIGRPRRNDVAELGAIATALKNLSKTIGVPVIALHQLNRSNYGNRPALSDLRASGEIAETANTVVAIYRSEVAKPDYEPLKGYAEVLIRKQRQGRRDVRAWAISKLGNMRFESCEAPEGYDENICEDKPTGSAANAGGISAIQPRRYTGGKSRSAANEF